MAQTLKEKIQEELSEDGSLKSDPRVKVVFPHEQQSGEGRNYGVVMPVNRNLPPSGINDFYPAVIYTPQTKKTEVTGRVNFLTRLFDPLDQLDVLPYNTLRELTLVADGLAKKASA